MELNNVWFGSLPHSSVPTRGKCAPSNTMCADIWQKCAVSIFLHYAMTPEGVPAHWWAINYSKEQTLTMELDMKRKHPYMLVTGHAPSGFYHRAVTARETGFWESHGALRATMCHSDERNVSHRNLQSHPTFSRWMTRRVISPDTSTR